jgi:hypothetical protein
MSMTNVNQIKLIKYYGVFDDMLPDTCVGVPTLRILMSANLYQNTRHKRGELNPKREKGG